jgi:hypothetical protein
MRISFTWCRGKPPCLPLPIEDVAASRFGRLTNKMARSVDRAIFYGRWRRGDSNPRPLQCDCSALPTELRPRLCGDYRRAFERPSTNGRWENAGDVLSGALGGCYNRRRCGCNSVGRVSASQAECRGFESHRPLHIIFMNRSRSSRPSWPARWFRGTCSGVPLCPRRVLQHWRPHLIR